MSLGVQIQGITEMQRVSRPRNVGFNYNVTVFTLVWDEAWKDMGYIEMAHRPHLPFLHPLAP